MIVQGNADLMLKVRLELDKRGSTHHNMGQGIGLFLGRREEEPPELYEIEVMDDKDTQ